MITYNQIDEWSTSDSVLTASGFLRYKLYSLLSGAVSVDDMKQEMIDYLNQSIPLNERDPLIPQVLEFIDLGEMGTIAQGSIMKLCSIGFNRAGRLLYQMSTLGYIESTDNPQVFNVTDK